MFFLVFIIILFFPWFVPCLREKERKLMGFVHRGYLLSLRSQPHGSHLPRKKDGDPNRPVLLGLKSREGFYEGDISALKEEEQEEEKQQQQHQQQTGHVLLLLLLFVNCVAL